MDQFGPVKGFVIAKFFADKNFLAMNTFLLGVGLASSNSLETVEKVRQITKESLLTDDNSASAIQERMDKKLVDVFGEGLYRLWVDSTYNYSAPEKKSFYINILVKNAGNIVLTAEYKELELLKQPIQCHKCLDMVQGGPDGMLDHMYQVHKAIGSYPKDYNTR